MNDPAYFEWVVGICEELDQPPAWGKNVLDDKDWQNLFDRGLTPAGAIKEMKRNGLQLPSRGTHGRKTPTPFS